MAVAMAPRGLILGQPPPPVRWFATIALHHSTVCWIVRSLRNEMFGMRKNSTSDVTSCTFYGRRCVLVLLQNFPPVCFLLARPLSLSLSFAPTHTLLRTGVPKSSLCDGSLLHRLTCGKRNSLLTFSRFHVLSTTALLTSNG